MPSSLMKLPSLRQTLYNLELTRRIIETGTGYLERHPKMMENARQVLEVKQSLNLEVKSAIEDLKISMFNSAG